MKIAFFEVENWEKEYVRQNLTQDETQFFDNPLTEDLEDELSGIEAISIFIYSKINKDVLNKLPDLKYITTRSTGFDHIDMDACRERGIQVSNVPIYGENTVAEHCFALILALSRKIVPSIERVRRGDFSPSGLRGFDLKGKTLGIVGTGHIGKHVARMAHGFDMDILGFDIQKDETLEQKYNLKYVPIEELLKNSDIITLHLPDNAKTHHFLDKNKIALIKPGAYLINTSRGGLVDTEALLKALQEERLAGAGLDVLEEECNVKEERQILSKQFPKKCLLLNIANNMLIKDSRVIITPHNAFDSQEALMRILSTTMENIKGFTAKNPINMI